MPTVQLTTTIPEEECQKLRIKFDVNNQAICLSEIPQICK